MKTTIFKNGGIFIVILLNLVYISCTPESDTIEEDNNITTNTLTINNLNITLSVTENLATNTALDTIKATTETGSINYTLKSSNPAGAIKINDDGEIKIDDHLAFDFETNTQITAVITVSNDTETKDVTITINITDIDETISIVKDTFTVTTTSLLRDTGRNQVTISALGENNESLTFNLTGSPELPTSEQTYSVANGEAYIGYSTDVSSYTNYFSLPNANKTGEITITPKGNGTYAFEIKNVFLSNFFTKAELTLSQAGEVEFYSGNYTVSNVASYLGSGDTSHSTTEYSIGNNVWSSSTVTLGASTPISDNFPYGTSGHIKLKLPLNITAGDYTVKTAEFSPAVMPDGEVYLSGATFGGNTNVTQFNATSGTVSVTETSGILKFTFNDLNLLFVEDESTETLSGVFELKRPE